MPFIAPPVDGEIPERRFDLCCFEQVGHVPNTAFIGDARRLANIEINAGETCLFRQINTLGQGNFVESEGARPEIFE